MSQIYKPNAGGGGGGGVTEVDTQSGNAVPSAGVLLLNGYDTTENNVFGIETKGNTNGGNPPGTGATNETDVYLTNRFHGSATSTGVTPVTLMTCPMPLNSGVYQFIVIIVGHDTTNSLGTSTVDTITFRTTAGASVLISGGDYVTQEDPAFVGTISYNSVLTPGVLTIQVSGPALTNINWSGHGTYTVVN